MVWRMKGHLEQMSYEKLPQSQHTSPESFPIHGIESKKLVLSQHLKHVHIVQNQTDLDMKMQSNLLLCIIGNWVVDDNDHGRQKQNHHVICLENHMRGWEKSGNYQKEKQLVGLVHCELITETDHDFLLVLKDPEMQTGGGQPLQHQKTSQKVNPNHKETNGIYHHH